VVFSLLPFFFVISPLADAADEPPDYDAGPAHKLHYTNAVFLRGNPLGLIDILRVGWRARLSDKDSVLLRDTYVFVGPSALVTPAYTRLGGYAEAQLLAVLRVFGQVEGIGYYGNFSQVLSFSDPGNAVYDDATMDAQGTHAARTGWVFLGGATARAAVGPIAIRTTPQLERYDLNLPDGDTAFYDQYWDRLAPNGGWMWMQDSDVLLLAGKARLGVRHTFSDNLDASTGAGGRAHHRVGPLFAWQFHDKGPGTRFDQPTLFLLAQWWAQHPYRAGQVQPAALPLLAGGLAFKGDLWTSKR